MVERWSARLASEIGGSMTDALSADYLGSKQPELGGHERLRKGQLGPLDIAAATMANIGPAMSFYFGFGYLAYTAGLASPLTIVLAGVAILFLGNTLSEFCKVSHRPAGSSLSSVRLSADARR